MTIHTIGELRAQHLTGRVRGRVGRFGRVIMQVEVRSPNPRYPTPPPSPGQTADVWARGSYTFWRDATHADLANGGCTPRALTDLSLAPPNPPTGGTSGSKA